MIGGNAENKASRMRRGIARGGWQDMWIIGSYLSWVAVKNI